MICLLTQDDYYSQRNNSWDDPATREHERYSACMPTARVMWYRANKIRYTTPLADRWADDDYFMMLLNGMDAKTVRDKSFTWASGLPPNQIHGMYLWLDQQVCGHIVSRFAENLSLEMIKAHIKSGHAVMSSGRFMGQAGVIEGHAFVFVGLDDDGQLLIADPYGDYHTHYASPKGYLVPMPDADFDIHTKPISSTKKWGHVPI